MRVENNQWIANNKSAMGMPLRGRYLSSGIQDIPQIVSNAVCYGECWLSNLSSDANRQACNARCGQSSTNPTPPPPPPSTGFEIPPMVLYGGLALLAYKVLSK